MTPTTTTTAGSDGDVRPETSPELARAVADVLDVVDARSNGRGDRSAWFTELGIGGGFVVTCAVLVATWLFDGPASGAHDLALALVLGVVHGLASRVMFESSGGAAIPTAPIVVAALFLLPLALVPAVVLMGLLIGTIGSGHDTGETGVHRLLVPAISGWNSVAAVLVLSVHGAAEPDLRHWPWYLAALIAQFAADALTAVVRVRSLGMSWRVLPGPMSWTYLVDTTLAPIGLTAVIAADSTVWSLPLAAAPVALLALLARDRAAHLDKAVAIGEAFEAAVATARRDPLTGLGNRRAWNEATTRAAVEYAADPIGASVVVVLGDLDGLKAVNDEHGHDAGDDLLRSAARALADAAPPGALVARVGGDEFGMLVTGGALTETELLARIRARMSAADSVHGRPVSMSLGAASCPPLPDVEEALAAADSLAFADKAARRAGRS